MCELKDDSVFENGSTLILLGHACEMWLWLAVSANKKKVKWRAKAALLAGTHCQFLLWVWQEFAI
ncbi:hypothetical protein [Pseudogemmobacter sp. W21_MBD1_M6]|uniref:hypothetical protein n=1 Tax=Pseudogemmobacter sp. W21_MBD1_M6 TaxID=3240271 RepID=UPI003F9BDC38